MSDRIRIFLYLRAPEEGPGAIEAAYHKISGILEGTPGLIGNELLRGMPDETAFAVMSEWESFEAFHSWDVGPDHKDQTGALRPYQDQTLAVSWGSYTVAASYRYDS